ncbi:MAG: tetratricopeptide repeat protein [Chitinophagales bacterium]|nr:tetratricopeptide repeat protein [Chitinophagales bacterium]
MAKTKDEGAELQEAYSKLEQFLDSNKTLVTTVVTILAIVILGAVFLKTYYIPNQEAKAQAEIYKAQYYFSQDSFKLALYGSPELTGFQDIIKSYKFTKAANLSKYYAGISHLNMGNYDDAIKLLKGYNAHDDLTGALAASAAGDAYMQKGEVEKGLSQYSKAASIADDEFVAPKILFKAAQAHQKFGEDKQALVYYEKIKYNYPTSSEGPQVDKYIEAINGVL